MTEMLHVMLHIMLWYLEVHTNLRLASICIIPLELRTENNIKLDTENNDDGFFVNYILDQVFSNKEDLLNWC